MPASDAVDPAVVAALAALGHGGVARIPEQLATHHGTVQLLMVGHQPWRTVAGTLDANDLKAVIRGVVLLSQASGWSGGSVSPVIPLYHAYAERFPNAADELAEWVLANRVNEYEPFGQLVPRHVTSLAAWAQERAAQQERRDRRAAAEVLRQEDGARRRADRATQHLRNAVRRGDQAAVEALLAQGADVRTVGEDGMTLVSVAEANGHASLAAFLRVRGAD